VRGALQLVAADGLLRGSPQNGGLGQLMRKELGTAKDRTPKQMAHSGNRLAASSERVEEKMLTVSGARRSA